MLLHDEQREREKQGCTRWFPILTPNETTPCGKM